MFRPGFSHFLAASLALHAVALLPVRSEPPAQHWFAGPVIVRLMPVPESTRENRPESAARTATAVTAKKSPARHPAAGAGTLLPQRRPARIPHPLPETAAELPDTDASRRPARQQATDDGSRSAELEQRLLDSLRTALIPHFSYPLLARRRGWEGIVRIGLRIEANGSLTRLHLVEASPYDVLNTAAINSLVRLARLPNAGDWLQGRHVDLVLPVEYRLLEG